MNIDRTSANSSGQGNLLNDALDNQEPPASAERTRNRMKAMPPARGIRFTGAHGNSGQCRPLPAADARSVPADDRSIEKLRSLMGLLRSENRVLRLPRATPLRPIPGLRAVSANISAITDRLAIHPTQRRSTMPHRRHRSLPGVGLLLGSAIVALLCAGVAATRSLPAMDTRQATSQAPDEPLPERLASLPQRQLPSAATPSVADRPPQRSMASEFSASTGPISAIPEPGSGVERTPAVGLDGQDAKQNLEETAEVAAAVICYASAPAVTRDHPDAWPAWTLHAPGHEGTRCWHAATRALVHSHRTESPPKKQRIGTLDSLGLPVRQTD